jgi:hypothetical protein
MLYKMYISISQLHVQKSFHTAVQVLKNMSKKLWQITISQPFQIRHKVYKNVSELMHRIVQFSTALSIKYMFPKHAYHQCAKEMSELL